MRPTLTFAVVSLFAVNAVAASPDKGVAAAKERLENARSNLAKLVKIIEKDPPSTADLDAAHAAVGALKDAIDAGAEHEPTDLDYARAVLAARKELRTHRDYVDQRRSKVHIHNGRRTIDAALATLAEKARRADAKDATLKEFEEARAAAGAVKKAADEARQFTKQDEGFAKYIAEADATVAKHEKAIDDRSLQQSVDKQRASLDEGRKGLTAAMGALTKGSTDAQFEAADKALAEVNKRLDAGKLLEPKDKAYGAEAAKSRTEIAAAKKRMDELWGETGVERLKAEIEPAHKDLVEAGKGVKSRGATADQLAEARTAAIVVRKLVEKFQPKAERSQAFAAYLNDVKKSLAEVEGELNRRTIAVATTAANQALRKVEGRNPTAETFDEADKALAALEKAAEAVQQPDAALAAIVYDAKRLAKDGRASLAKRQTEVDSDAARKALDGVKAPVVQALRKVEARSPAEADFAAANDAVAALEKALEGVKKGDSALAIAVADAKTLVKNAKATLAKRRAEVESDLARKNLDAVKQPAVAALRKVEGRNPTDESFQETNNALEALEKALEGVKKTDAALVAAVADAKTFIKNARASLAKRRLEVDIQVQRGKVEEARRALVGFMQAVFKQGSGSPEVQAAEAGIQKVLSTLEEGVALTKKDREYATYAVEVKKRIAEFNEQLAKRKLVLAAGDGKKLLNDLLATAKARIQAALQATSADADVEAAVQAVEAVLNARKERQELEYQDRAYSSAAEKVGDEMSQVKKDLELAKKARELKRATVEALATGNAAADSAAGAKDIRAQKDWLEKALTQYKSCESTGNGMLEETKPLAGVAVMHEGKPATAKDVIGACGQKAKAAEQQLAQVKGLISFEDGPKKSFEKGKDLLKSGKKPEALEQYRECIATGAIVLRWNPEFKERKFEVAGSSLTLAEIMAQCTKQRDALQGK